MVVSLLYWNRRGEREKCREAEGEINRREIEWSRERRGWRGGRREEIGER